MLILASFIKTQKQFTLLVVIFRVFRVFRGLINSEFTPNLRHYSLESS